MRKITKKSILSLIAVFVLVAAFSGAVVAQDLNDGQYVGYVPGDHGDIVIEVKVNFGEITGVEILNNLKTTQYPHEQAREYFVNFPSAVIRNQGTEGIDAISGATGSHNSYTEAVDMALSIARDNYDDNTYYGVSRDYAHGHYLVEAVIEGEEIKSINLITAKNPEEEALVGDKVEGEYPHEPAVKAFNEWPEKALNNQTTDVDVVSGATHTIEALNDALAQCLTQAGLNPDDYK
ncbi:MAG TPA: FMN-binding protein [Halanaerobiales bacterium]|nr:FMN-binding protein [Halanaerobiales bacterium]